MIGRIVEIAEDGRHLSVHRGFLKVEAGGEELGRVPLDDIVAVVANAHGLTYSNNLLVALAERGAPFVITGPNHQPAAILWPVAGHHLQTARMLAQAEAGRPLRKRLWQVLVQAKVRNQGAVLEAIGQPHGAFERLASSVRSGDPDNVEAQAARRYWPLLMGSDFQRDKDGDGVNGLLNYGYAILRSASARAVMAAGLHPSLGIHHHNRGNPMCLVDDLMEPFRPIVDLAVFRLQQHGEAAVTVEAKRSLAGLLRCDMATGEGITPLGTCVQRLAQSVASSFESGRPTMVLPQRPLPLEMPDETAASSS